MKHSTDMGMNRTGIGMAPRLSADMVKGLEGMRGGSDGGQEMAGLRTDYGKEAPALGSTPPPATLKGAVKTGVDMIKGTKPTVFMDKLGERLAFERTGTRLYEAMLAKFDSDSSWPGGPTRDQILLFHDQERSHFELVREAIESLGGDPTAMTPAADVVGVASEGVLKVVADPRSSLPESMEALLVAELVDHDGWEMLIRLSDYMGHKDLSTRFRSALAEEDEHLRLVREWLNKGLEQDARGELH